MHHFVHLSCKYKARNWLGFAACVRYKLYFTYTGKKKWTVGRTHGTEKEHVLQHEVCNGWTEMSKNFLNHKNVKDCSITIFASPWHTIIFHCNFMLLRAIHDCYSHFIQIFTKKNTNNFHFSQPQKIQLLNYFLQFSQHWLRWLLSSVIKHHVLYWKSTNAEFSLPLAFTLASCSPHSLTLKKEAEFLHNVA
jgi:hypothetical protein